MKNLISSLRVVILASLLVFITANAANLSTDLRRAVLVGDDEKALPLIEKAPQDVLSVPGETSGNSMMHWAADGARDGNLAAKQRIVAGLLARGIDIDVRNNRGDTPFITVAGVHGKVSDSKYQMLLFMVDKGAAIDAVNTGGYGLLNHAVFHADLRLLDYLLSQGVDPDQRARKDVTGLMVAAERGWTVVIDRLLAAGANLEAVDSRGRRSLHRAAVAGSALAIQHLLDLGSELEARDKQGMTPLSAAANARRWAVVRFLLEHGAEPTAPMSQGGTVALHLTLTPELGLTKLIGVSSEQACTLDSNGAKRVEKLLVAGDIDELERMAALGCHLGPGAEEKPLLGQLASIWVAKGVGRERAVTVLLKLGADINYHTSRNATPLGDAASFGNLPLARVLIARGADVNLRYIYGPPPARTALQVAMIHNRFEVAGLLLAHGAKLDLSTVDAWDAIKAAAKTASGSSLRRDTDQQLALRVLENVLGTQQEVITDFPRAVIAYRYLLREYPGRVHELLERISLRSTKPVPSFRPPGSVAFTPQKTAEQGRTRTVPPVPKIPTKSYSAEARLYVVGVYEGSRPGDDKPWWANCDLGGDTAAAIACHQKFARPSEPGKVEIDVGSVGVPLILALMAYDETEWHITTAPGVNIEGVILAGYHGQKVTGLPPGTHVEAHTYKPSQCSPCLRADDYFYTYSKEEGGAQYARAIGRLMRITSKAPQSFQGSYRGSRFDIRKF